MSAGPFSRAELDRFIRDGYIHLEGAFPAKVAEACREEIWKILESEKGIVRTDSSSWTQERVGLTKIFKPSHGAPWKNVFTERVYSGISQLVGGTNSWNREALGCGWWVVSFPSILSPPWEACGNWHIDGNHFRHFVHSREQVLLPIFLFSDIEPNHGGTALAVGSHVRTASVLYQQQDGLPGGRLSQEIRATPGILDTVVEVTGQAGDIVFLHPFLLHARSKNLGPKSVSCVRIACFPCVSAIEALNVNDENAETKDLSPVEQGIVQARELASLPFAFGKRKRSSRAHFKRAKR